MRKFSTGPSALLTMLLCSSLLSACGGTKSTSASAAEPTSPTVLGSTSQTPPVSMAAGSDTTLVGVAPAPGTPTAPNTPAAPVTPAAPGSHTTPPAATNPPPVATNPPPVATNPPPVATNPPGPAVPPPVVLVPPPPAPVTPVPTPTPTPTPQPPVVLGERGVTDVRLQNLQAGEQTAVAVTFGQVFAVGHVPSGQTVTGKLSDGTAVPLQVDVKARHPDGSVRHAIISAKIARLAGNQKASLILEKVAAPAASTTATPAALLDAGFTASAQVDLDGERYSASADALLRSGKYTSWLAGPVANEWLLSAPLVNAAGKAHPHLSARFAIRAYGTKQARVDVTLENTWAFEADPQNFKYDAKIVVGGHTVYTKDDLNHLHHARWRKVFWWGGEPAVHVAHNVAYLLDSRALPNFDRTVVPSQTRIAAMKAGWTGEKTEPMGVGMAVKYMPTTGGREDIGLLPAWAASYLLSQDPRAKEVTLGTATLAGTWSSHYRDKETDRPVKLSDYPYMTTVGHEGDTVNPVTKKHESFPACARPNACTSPYAHDSSHQPAFAYLPYLVTGDYYYLEELQFWATWDSFYTNPGYRDNISGLVKTDQVRGQAWSLRTIGEAGYISPDNDPLKAEFVRIINANMDWYNVNYTNNPAAPKLGMLSHGYAMAYSSGTGVAPWMDDFFTSAVGHLVEMGYEKAKPLLAWKTKFPVERMLAPGACWINAASYTLIVRDTATSPIYDTMAEAWKATNGTLLGGMACNSSSMAAALNLKVGEMTGYAYGVTGYPSNMQPALAYAADVDPVRGAAAWKKFNARAVKPDYALGAQFSIVPR